MFSSPFWSKNKGKLVTELISLKISILVIGLSEVSTQDIGCDIRDFLLANIPFDVHFFWLNNFILIN